MKLGIGVSPGIGVGKALVKKDRKVVVKQLKVDDCSAEIKKFENALKKYKQRVKALYNKMLNLAGENEAQIFSAHLSILDDPVFQKEMKQKIQKLCCNAEYALKEVTEYFIKMFNQIEDEYLKERASDVKDVMEGVLSELTGAEDTSLAELDEKVIIVAEDLSPSDTAQLDKDKVVGFVTALGGTTSHSAIMARAMGIPAVSGVKNITRHVNNGDTLIIDGEAGEVFIKPSKELIEEYKKRHKKYEEIKKVYLEYKDKKSISKDNYKIKIAANIGFLNEIDIALNNGAEGIGLFRTEFLFMDRHTMPTEEEQFSVYKTAAEKMTPHAVIVRTLDCGGDKQIPYIKIPGESNPFLGCRAIRICLNKKDIFKTQLRALLRASAYGDIKIMFPMISSVQELRAAKELLEEVKGDLNKENISYNKRMDVGMMVEVPSAAILSDVFSREVDFFSIGTNDLIQYTIAVDRGNENICHLYDGYHPSVLRLIYSTIVNAHKNGIWVGICGELASDELIIPLLLGMGIDELSINAGLIPKSRWIVNNTVKHQWEKEVEKILNMTSGEEVTTYLNQLKRGFRSD